MTSKNTEFLLAYRYLKGIGKKYLNTLAFEAERTNTSVQDCFEYGKLNEYSSEDINVALNKAREQVEIADQLGHTIISRLDTSYPTTLRGIPDAPPLLFCHGNLDLLSEDIITIIGTRSPTIHGVAIADRVTKWFASNGWVIASGLAKGIDTVAHESCLQLEGKTISVLAHGLEKIYPAQNKELAKNIAKSGGLLISEYSYNSYVAKANFVERDRIQAALAKAVVLVQSDLIGGSLHASRASLDYNRFLIVLGQSPRDIIAKESKISANIMLIEGSDEEKANLLKITKQKLDRLLVVPDKRHLDYVNDIIKNTSFNLETEEIGNNIDLF
ncbi:TPA: DNA-processing protein DprA [Vibrio vulnificus]|uniref:DNA-processing protein DprA n=1 Tax=Vibrio vulnificus TaxID=672 RepID=UPI0019D4938E|nr:DNA-processing protein DprA [Vibrio vulnificus]MBN8146063.1 DNA-protecting protein DprA [Vibrio vulnificus]HAS6161656.1 DNA-processing protein DprA [Vibrio vulnificus]